MSIIPLVKRSILAMSFVLPVLAAVPAQAQGDGPLSTCLEQSGRETAAFDACLIQHQEELQALYNLPADWPAQVHAYLRAHLEAWDQLEDVADRMENRRDRAENTRDRHEDWLDQREDQRDDQVNLEDLFDRRKDVRDRAEDRSDRREGVRDRIENHWDRRNGASRNKATLG